jgi:hypothetical protein
MCDNLDCYYCRKHICKNSNNIKKCGKVCNDAPSCHFFSDCRISKNCIYSDKYNEHGKCKNKDFEDRGTCTDAKSCKYFIFKEDKILPPPVDLELPFFAYGFFKSGELAFNKIKQFVDNKNVKEATILGDLFEKDGVPIVSGIRENDCNNVESRKIKGELLPFIDPKPAYEAINEIEPANLYVWRKCKTIDNDEVNVLVASKNILDDTGVVLGGEQRYYEKWCCSSDPLFVFGMDFLKANYFDRYKNGKPNDLYNEYSHVFELQMAYTFLWSIIDRHGTLKYNLSSSGMGSKNDMLARDPVFINSVLLLKDRFLTDEDEKVVNSASKLRRIFNITAFKKAARNNKMTKMANAAVDILGYYYAIRNNSVHRGKVSSDSNKRDYMLLRYSFLELFAIMTNVISCDIGKGPNISIIKLFLDQEIKR